LAIKVPVSEVTGAVSVLTTVSLVTIVIVLVIAAGMIGWCGASLDLSRHWEPQLGASPAATSHRESWVLSPTTKSGQKITQATDQVAASSEELMASAEQSSQAANQVAIAITEVANGSEKQLKAVDDTSVVVQQMSVGVQQIATKATNCRRRFNQIG